MISVVSKLYIHIVSHNIFFQLCISRLIFYSCKFKLAAYPSMVTMPPSTDYMDKMTPSPAPLSSSEYEFKYEPQQQTQH